MSGVVMAQTQADKCSPLPLAVVILSEPQGPLADALPVPFILYDIISGQIISL